MRSKRPTRNKKKYYVYMLLCGNGNIYTGQTNNLKRRVDQHKSGRGARYTKKHGVKKLLGYKIFNTRGDAMREENRIKRELGHHEKRKLAKRWRK